MLGVCRYHDDPFKVNERSANHFVKQLVIIFFSNHRTLGIPARTITTFASAHDTDNSLTVDRFFEPNGNEIKGVNGDSVWNFHVWTEVSTYLPYNHKKKIVSRPEEQFFCKLIFIDFSIYLFCLLIL